MGMANIQLDGPNIAAYQLEYYEPNGPSPGWYTLPMTPDPNMANSMIASYGPPATGFPLQNGASRFRIMPPAGAAGTLNYNVELENVATGAMISNNQNSVTVSADPNTMASLKFNGPSELTAGVQSQFAISVGDVTAAGTMVMGYLTVTGGNITDIEYYEPNGVTPGWYSMPAAGNFGPPGTGFPLILGATSQFRYTPPANLAGSEIQYTITLVEVCTNNVVATYEGSLGIN